ncbi:MAG TPA: hypothetical protein VLM40_16835, partial [Gemmata sp.]|nr:hypothetical protein [Gemmata sp.]
AGYVALVMKNPGIARKLKAKFMRREKAYSSVFSDRTAIHTWVAITEILKRIDPLLQPLRTKAAGGRERFLAGWRNTVAFMAVSRVLGKYSYSVEDLTSFDPETITLSMVEEIWELILAQPGPTRIADGGRKPSFILRCCEQAAIAFHIANPEVIGRQSLPTEDCPLGQKRIERLTVILTPELIDRIDAALPAQPWKPGIHRIVAQKLGCAKVEVSAAISKLVEQGRRNRQLNGVVYDADGKIIAVDRDRVPE